MVDIEVVYTRVKKKNCRHQICLYLNEKGGHWSSFRGSQIGRQMTKFCFIKKYKKRRYWSSLLSIQNGTLSSILDESKKKNGRHRSGLHEGQNVKHWSGLYPYLQVVRFWWRSYVGCVAYSRRISILAGKAKLTVSRWVKIWTNHSPITNA